mmetsp:Transcript_1419/g.1883  ORF Transcript_1419/g.1883 Transcript_1419/m.1883 type:complete len:112 (+) Transcript_1419:50-385(+)
MAQINMEENYKKIAQIISQHGKPNPAFPKDKDLDYGTLSKLANFGGLQAALKTMKKKKMVDFQDQGFLKDNSVVTLISDYDQEAQPTQITYDQINEKIQGEVTSHQKANYN